MFYTVEIDESPEYQEGEVNIMGHTRRISETLEVALAEALWATTDVRKLALLAYCVDSIADREKGCRMNEEIDEAELEMVIAARKVLEGWRKLDAARDK